MLKNKKHQRVRIFMKSLFIQSREKSIGNIGLRSILPIGQALFGMPDATIPFGPIYANVPEEEDDDDEE